jgi:hypothetical protein
MSQDVQPSGMRTPVSGFRDELLRIGKGAHDVRATAESPQRAYAHTSNERPRATRSTTNSPRLHDRRLHSPFPDPAARRSRGRQPLASHDGRAASATGTGTGTGTGNHEVRPAAGRPKARRKVRRANGQWRLGLGVGPRLRGQSSGANLSARGIPREASRRRRTRRAVDSRVKRSSGSIRRLPSGRRNR